MSGIYIVIEGSGKHCHVTRETLDVLYGKDFQLEHLRDLSQPGQFVTPHKVQITGPKSSTEVSIIGPCRSKNQVELSFTDASKLGLKCPIRESGDVEGSPGLKMKGPAGEFDISEGAIIAKRHIHLTPEDAEKFGIKDKQIVKVRVGGERGLVFDEVVSRVSPEYATFMHIDYDEMNAAGLSGTPNGEIIL